MLLGYSYLYQLGCEGEVYGGIYKTCFQAQSVLGPKDSTVEPKWQRKELGLNPEVVFLVIGVPLRGPSGHRH